MTKKSLIPLITFFLILSINSMAASVKEIVNKVENENVVISTAKDYHITSSTSAIINGSVNLTSEESWLFFDNINPAKVLQDYSNYILIKGEKVQIGVNARVTVYAHGTVIMPHSETFHPLTVYTERNFLGDSLKCERFHYYRADNAQDYLSKPLGKMNDAIRSFKLKRGYMATFSNSATGNEYSRVFIADEDDLEIPVIQAELDKSISFIRVFEWNWVTKKGWCGTGTGSMIDAAKTNSTWNYSWSADLLSTESIEWVPMRHNKSWPSWGEINAVDKSSHLLGFNEPDRSDQALMTVEEAIAQWPEMLKTGLRLGSPCPSDPWNGNNWLFRFIDKCDELDYRVDYVVIHTYWGNKSPQNWYKDLKAIHERTKRPLWITEWNNGANWTTESWPSDVAGQQAKQLKDIQGILQVLDTASFIERYSIYNWVEDKRAIILNGSLTPAGEYYADNKSVLAFNRAKEAIPQWKLKSPNLYSLVVGKNGSGTTLSWSDPNGSMTTGFIVERKYEGEDYVELAKLNNNDVLTFVDNSKVEKSGYVTYRITSEHDSGNLESNEISYYITGGGDEQYGFLSQNSDSWLTCRFINEFAIAPSVIVGIASYNNGAALPFTVGVNQLDVASFQFRLSPWVYLGSPVFNKSEDIPFMALSDGKYQWGNIQAQAKTVSNINGAWKSITFDEPFASVPVVIATQITNRSQIPTTVRVKNVTTTGFDIMIQKEEAQTKTLARENVSYIAATTGSGTYAGQKIVVGKTDDNVVGGFYNSHKISFNDTFEKPMLFAGMQTVNDTITSTLRYNKMTSTDAVIFKNREASVSNTQSNIATETVGWIVLETTQSVGIDEIDLSTHWSIYPNPVSDILFLEKSTASTVRAEIYDLQGVKVMDQNIDNSINISNLKGGMYIMVLNKSQKFRFLKK